MQQLQIFTGFFQIENVAGVAGLMPRDALNLCCKIQKTAESFACDSDRALPVCDDLTLKVGYVDERICS
jgi:hypothetical protein